MEALTPVLIDFITTFVSEFVAEQQESFLSVHPDIWALSTKLSLHVFSASLINSICKSFSLSFTRSF